MAGRQNGVAQAGVDEGQRGVNAKPICSARCGFRHVPQFDPLAHHRFQRAASRGRASKVISNGETERTKQMAARNPCKAPRNRIEWREIKIMKYE